jgi:hypothetical protein
MRHEERETVVRVKTAVLRGIVAGLFAMLGAAVPVMTRATRLSLLELLRPAEAAARRLIVVAASGMAATGDGSRRSPPSREIPAGDGRKRVPVFRLFDPRTYPGPPRHRKSTPGIGPRITEIGRDPHVPAPPQRTSLPDDPVDGGALRRRLAALHNALENIPGQARRLNRILARGRSKWRRPMRPGRPPGHRARGMRPVDEALADLHFFAMEVMRDPAPP